MRKVNDVILSLFGNLKPAHDLLSKAVLPENRPINDPEEDDHDGKNDSPADAEPSIPIPGRYRKAEKDTDMSPVRRSNLIDKYMK